ncbi:MAG: LuxR family transcriptional regulator [Nitrospira sp.]|jgi:DNA-binding CsgD family transcriptional regulator/L-rhamnose mutarotase|nr:LuxR family transcriptional regulator [Nitrospira sp.]MDH4252409.1 LuxR family transcriptional regulator [Nitrospira sp.]MDH4341959.1 LuxR family transcriptional regulator [Nitrospira sp.]MDH5336883.1 LuxR family transcriptional regulator [Nitrospira sp.]
MDTAVLPFPAHIFEEASKTDLQNLLEVMHYAMLAETPKDVKDVLVRTKKFLPFEHLIGGLVRLSTKGGFEGFSDVLNVNFPQIWLFQYWKNRYGDVDPVLHALVRSQKAQVWNQVYADVKSEREKEFIETAASFGLSDGVTVGSLDPSCGVTSFFAFAGGEPALHARHVKFLDYLGQHLHLALLRSSPKLSCSNNNCVTTLSPREVTILNWIKNGKTNWEIAQITGVTERTIRFHVESIFSKLDVTSRTQAVAVAVQHGLPNLA